MNQKQPTLEIKGYRIARELFEMGYPAGGGPCTCTSSCCEGGVYADPQEKEKILANRQRIKKYMDETQSTNERVWFEENEFADPDFPSGRCVGTGVVNDKCAFLDRSGRCTLQVTGTQEGIGKWALKPLFCIMYPLEISDKVIGYDTLLQGEEQCCTVSNEFHTPIFRACKEELAYLLGEDGYQQLEEHFAFLQREQVVQPGSVKV